MLYKNTKCIEMCGKDGSVVQLIEANHKIHPRDVDVIPDIEVITDGVKYCISDGIGKISYQFAKEISRKLGLSHVPLAFQIHYAG